jgi:hypothetical protein
MCASACVQALVCKCMCASACVQVHVCKCMCASACVQVHVCKCMCASACVQAHVCKCMRASTCVQVHACKCMSASACVQVHACKRLCASACIQALVCKCMCASTCVQVHVCKRMSASACEQASECGEKCLDLCKKKGPGLKNGPGLNLYLYRLLKMPPLKLIVKAEEENHLLWLAMHFHRQEIQFVHQFNEKALFCQKQPNFMFRPCRVEHYAFMLYSLHEMMSFRLLCKYDGPCSPS